ncbi:hypothetical protein C9374_013836 [Naegleria lovaniensis]|uniref:Uncharacterized protein n=1 Tax=Naegleria lovaniensis TaxID=51637 RepID=A0AA88KQ35_NAELO|nr:uncharacterized protein C9374_013836 [Naegleria lovaniensis]KAG2389276.1 hypothetical protein C9374_013836 [Naegleria lovaniensis]
MMNSMNGQSGPILVLIHLYPFHSDIPMMNNENPTLNDTEPQSYEIDKLYSKLLTKMRSAKRTKGLGMNFEHLLTLSSNQIVTSNTVDNDNFKTPFDIEISYHHQCVLISDPFSSLYGRIQLFDLFSREWIASVYTTLALPTFIRIEENYDGNYNDALVMYHAQSHSRSSLPNVMAKYDFREIRKYSTFNESERAGPLWQREISGFVKGMALWKQQVFISQSDKHCISILDSNNGQLIQIIKVYRPCSLEIGHDFGELFISNGDHAIEIFRQNEKNTKYWNCVKTFGRKGLCNGEFIEPGTIVYDRISKYLIVSDVANTRFQVFTRDGTFVKGFQQVTNSKLTFPNYGRDDKTKCSNPRGMCLNEISGELIVCSSEASQVLFFK